MNMYSLDFGLISPRVGALFFESINIFLDLLFSHLSLCPEFLSTNVSSVLLILSQVLGHFAVVLASYVQCYLVEFFNTFLKMLE